MSLYGYFSPNSPYAKEDVRSAVSFWRNNTNHEKLLSYSEKYTVDRYLDESEKERHFPIVNTQNIVYAIRSFFSTYRISYAYVLLARDWDKRAENALRNAFLIESEKHFVGVKIFRVFSGSKKEEG